MKRILETAKLSVLVSVLFAAQAQAQAQLAPFEEREVSIHQTKSSLEIELNEQTVICSRADYSTAMLKVLVPGLADITLLDHENSGAGVPCMTTGQACIRPGRDQGARPNDVLQNTPGKEKIDVTVTATRIEGIDHSAKTCTVSLRENVETTIRGKKFFHQRLAQLGQRNYEDCVKAVTP